MQPQCFLLQVSRRYLDWIRTQSCSLLDQLYMEMVADIIEPTRKVALHLFHEVSKRDFPWWIVELNCDRQRVQMVGDDPGPYQSQLPC